MAILTLFFCFFCLDKPPDISATAAAAAPLSPLKGGISAIEKIVCNVGGGGRRRRRFSSSNDDDEDEDDVVVVVVIADVIVAVAVVVVCVCVCLTGFTGKEKKRKEEKK